MISPRLPMGGACGAPSVARMGAAGSVTFLTPSGAGGAVPGRKAGALRHKAFKGRA